jgi:hypothetical protein
VSWLGPSGSAARRRTGKCHQCSRSKVLPKLLVQNLPLELLVVHLRDHALLPLDGACLPRDGACLPWDNALLPSDGACLPRDGACLPVDGCLLPRDNALLPPDGALLPWDNALLPLDGACQPRDDALLPLMNDRELWLQIGPGAWVTRASTPGSADHLPSARKPGGRVTLARAAGDGNQERRSATWSIREHDPG